MKKDLRITKKCLPLQPFRTIAKVSSLIILKGKYKQKYREKESRALISIGSYEGQDKLRDKEYTKKSLILAQDER